MPRPLALALSAVPGDAALSCGGTLVLLARGGWTVVSASLGAPGGDAMAAWAEEREFARRAGIADPRWIRGQLDPATRGAAGLADALAGTAAELDPTLVLLPQALDGSPARVALVRAAAVAGLEPRCAWYRDVPAAIHQPASQPCGLVPGGLPERAVPIGSTLAVKLHACAAYRRRVGAELGGEQAMRAALERFARSEAAYAGRSGAVELLSVCTPEALSPRRPARPVLAHGHEHER